MIQETLRLFNKAIPTTPNVEFSVVNEYAVSLGYLVHPDLCNKEVLKWLKSNDRNFNSTFYKSWQSVISKNRFELYLDQIRHYASTYGTDYDGEVYLPDGEAEVPEFTKFKVISPITKDEVIDRCEKMLFAGIALKQETIESVLNILDELDYAIDIDKVKNKEAKMFLYKAKGTLPKEPVEMVRYLVYLATEKTLLIKDKETIQKVKASTISISKSVDQFGAANLSSVFYRFKPLFLALKKGKDKACINKLRRLAEKNHVPTKVGYFETILVNQKDFAVLSEKLKGLGNFKKITLLQTILIRLKYLNVRAFGIRNQKLYIKQERLITNASYLKMVFDVIYADLVQTLKKKACTIKLPVGVDIALPTSEKSFIGNYPLGTSFDFLDADNIVGINWKCEDGASDLDLKLIDVNGNQYGWNAAYKNTNNSIVFSGDMTSANPQATELFYTTKGFNPAIVKVNLYNGQLNSKFKFFLAKEKVSKMHSNYMVNPDNVIITVDCVMDSKEKQLGVIVENKFILANFRTGKGRVAGESVTNLYTDYALKTLDCYISLEKLLTDAGFVITENNAAIDLTGISKDTLISLLNK